MPWTDTLDNEMRAYAANKGWDRLEPDAAAQAVVKSYRELERLRPEPAPRTAAEYDLSDIRNGDGSVPEADVLDMVRGMAFDLKLPATAAKTLAQRLIKLGDDEGAAEAQARAQALADSTARLDAAWGADKDTKLAAAAKAFEAMNLPKETVDALVAQVGVDKIMQTGYDLSLKMGEASFHRGDPNMDNKTAWTRETALVERNRLIGDKAFYDKFIAGDAEAKKTFDEVTAAILGTPENWRAPPDNFGRQGDGAGHEITPQHSKWDERKAS